MQPVKKEFYRNLAHSYFCAAKALLKVFGEDENVPGIIKLIINPTSQDEVRDDILLLPHPFYYLLWQSLELYMKGYLFQEGMTKEELKKLKHDAIKLMEKCEEYDFEFNDEEKEYVIKIFNSLNSKDHPMRYPKEGDGKFPNFYGVSILIDKLEQKIKG